MDEVATPTAPLATDIANFVARCERQHRINWFQNYAIGVLTLLFSGAVVVAGLFDKGTIGAIFGVLTGLLLSFERFDPSGEKAQFYRELFTEGQRLAMDLRDKAQSDRAIRRQFMVLRNNEAKQIPRQGLGEAVRALNEHLSKAKSSGA